MRAVSYPQVKKREVTDSKLDREKGCHHISVSLHMFITPITLSAVSTGQLMEGMA